MSGHGWVHPNEDGSKARCGGPAICRECAQEAMAKGFLGTQPAAGTVTCPECGHTFAAGQAVRMTEATATKAAPYGDVAYADPGYQKDGKKRYPIDTEKHVKAAWGYINQSDNAALYSATQLQRVKAKIKAAAKKLGIEIADKATEALVNGALSYSDISDLVRAAVQKKILDAAGDGGYYYVWIADLSATDVVYEAGDADLWQCSYAITTGPDGHGVVELGDPVEVARTYAPVTPEEDIDPAGNLPEPVEAALEGTTEARDRIDGRLIESKGTDETGGRIFRVQVISYGDSKNARRYPESVLRTAAPMYDGAKAYNRHRTDEELRSSTIEGLVGYYRDPQATSEGVEADLHLLPSAVHAAEALDASLAAQAEGLPPMVGVSHDVMATYKPIVAGGQRLQEATAIVRVHSADIVADPAAGGKATRMVAGGINPSKTDSTKESDMPPTTAEVLAAFKTATAEDLAAVGLSRVSEATTTPTSTPTPAPAADGHDKTSFMGKMMIRAKLADAGLPETATEAVTTALPDRITESGVDAHIAALKTAMGIIERPDMVPTVGAVKVTQESVDKKRAALDAMFAKDFVNGYRSFKEAYADFTGSRPRALDTEDWNRVILRESFGEFHEGVRLTESMTSTSWSLVLGDSITRRLVAMYNQPSLQTWRQITSSIAPVNDFRTQRIERIGGYGVLPTVNQGAPYQPLTSPTNEEVTYAIAKRGGTEDITLEMIANDDIRAISQIPMKLGLAAAQTLFRFVWDTLPTNAAVSYDSTALFHALHGNTVTTAPLGQSNLSAGRATMRGQTAYGDNKDVLSIIPKFLVVPSALEELAWQLCTSAVAIPATPAGPTNTPNIHQGMQPLVIDYYSVTNAWYLICDPALCPTLEIGFYQGRELPELFTQADPTVGSVFNADKITYKIRHIYSGTVLDHRGFYRSN